MRPDGVESEDRWYHHKACIEAKQSREDAGSIRCSEKKLDGFTPMGYLGCMHYVRTFWTFVGRLYIFGWAVVGSHLFGVR